MKKIILSSLILILILPLLTLGLDRYTFEFGIPFIVNPGESRPISGFLALLQDIIKIMIPIAGFIGFLMLIYAGFEYALSGGNQNKQKDAQNKIKNVILGIVLLFLIWIILYIINPDILQIRDFNFSPFNSINNTNNYTGSIPPDLNITLYKQYLSRPSQIGSSYLAQQLASKINSLNTSISWEISDACIEGFSPNSDFPCKTTCLPGSAECSTRSVNDAHYYGLAVDIVTKNDPDNANLISLAKEICNKGLDVLVEENHLHVALAKQDYNQLGINKTVMGISPGTNANWSMGQWYTQGHCD